VNRFNLTFSGEIIAGHDPAQVRARLAKLLAIDDPALLQGCFSGDPVVLRGNLERKEAAGLYARLRRLGIHVELVKISERGDLHGNDPVETPVTAQADALQTEKTAEEPVAEPPKASTAAESPPVSTPSIKQTPSSVGTRNTGRDWPTAPAAARGAKTSGAGRKTRKAQEAIRKADQAAQKELQAEHDVQLQTKEKALRKALTTKEKEEAKRNRLGKQARKKTLTREAKHKTRLEASKHKTELAEKKSRAAVAAAEQKVQREREQAEVAAKRQSERELVQAKKVARQAAAKVERERKEAGERERLATERAELARQEQVQQEEKRRLAKEKAARRAQEKRKAEEVAARLQAENVRRKRNQAAEEAQRKAEEVRKKTEELVRLEAVEAEQQAQRRAMEEQAIQRAATELAQKPGLKAGHARVKTRLEMPSMKRRSEKDSGPRKRRKQRGAPNLYSLRPFRNTSEIRARVAVSNRGTQLAFGAAAFAFLAAAILAARLLSLPPPAQVSGASDIVIAPLERLLLVAGTHLLLHDRAGISVSDLSFERLGVADLQAPLAFDQAGRLLAPGQLSVVKKASGERAASPLLRCDLALPGCEIFSPELAGTVISALVVHPIDGSLFIADGSSGQLLKVSAEGSVLARATTDLPEQPVLRLDSGLLLMNSAQGSGISVFRYEDSAFGWQLDEVLLLPAADGTRNFTAVTDFVRNGDHWWAVLEQADSDSPGLYRFDTQWELIDRPPLAPGTRPAQLVNWGSRTLVRDPERIPVQRFNSVGTAEAALVSTGLSQLLEDQNHRSKLILLGWRIGLALCLLAAITGLCLGILFRIRSLVYTSCRERGAAPVDELADDIDWIEIAPDRSTSLGRTGIAYLMLAIGLVLGVIGLGASTIQLSALLLALAGPAIALLLFQRSEVGHIGISGEHLLLVDQSDMYHFGAGGHIHYRGPFLMIDDVTVFTGSPLLPAFSPAAIRERVVPIAAEGVKVDRKIVTVKLLQARHPLALGAAVILATLAGAVTLLSLHGIF
jgi:hypothetical protein